ncbi:squalene/phytoene synthase family protein [Streptomyces sp. NPDC004126]|uniref:squalene/phytoene synthase family protein n=1 Tax=Streptomyces sp. NPDC004126 TaxID=3390695 RepID=UPI003D09367A
MTTALVRASHDPLSMLRATARTFAVPIMWLPPGIRHSTTAANLCLRAVDEIEDHPTLPPATRIRLLTDIAGALCTSDPAQAVTAVLAPHAADLPEVSRRLTEWLDHAPPPTRARIREETAAMALRMAEWVRRDWQVHTEGDLDHYTYSVFGSVGLLMSDLWFHHDGTRIDPDLTITFFRGLQAVHILQVCAGDPVRRAKLLPDGWSEEDLARHIEVRLRAGDRCVGLLPPGTARSCYSALLAIARPTTRAALRGQPKLSRPEAIRLMADALFAR